MRLEDDPMFSSSSELFGDDSDADSDSDIDSAPIPHRPNRPQLKPPQYDSDSDSDDDNEYYSQPQRKPKKKSARFADTHSEHEQDRDYVEHARYEHYEQSEKKSIIKYLQNIAFVLVIVFVFVFVTQLKPVRGFVSRNIEQIDDDTYAMHAITSGMATVGIGIYLTLQYLDVL